MLLNLSNTSALAGVINQDAMGLRSSRFVEEVTWYSPAAVKIAPVRVLSINLVRRNEWVFAVAEVDDAPLVSVKV